MSLYESLTRVLAPFAEKIKGIQTGYDGTTYSSPGEAVRTQISDLHVLIGDEPGTAIQGGSVSYDGTESGLTATTVQAAIDENAANVSSTNERLEHLEEGGLNIKDEVIEADINAWLNAHPEATTTVQDRSITQNKMAIGAMSFVSPEMFGAVGDGTADDTQSIQNAINSGFPVRFASGKTYIVTGLSIPHGIYIDGNGATIKRPNLKTEPYNWTDTQISWGRMFAFTGQNTNDKVTVFRNIKIDGNAFEMWQESDGPKYEHATFIPITSNASYRARVIIDGCIFMNNYSSAISVQGYSDLTLTNCICKNCSLGIVTFVGVGSKMMASNLFIYNDYDSFYGINIEINSNSYYESARSDVYLSNVYAEGNTKLCAMTGGGSLNVKGLYACKLSGKNYIDSAGMANISDSEFHLKSTAKLFLRPSGGSYAPAHNCIFNFNNVTFECDDETSVVSPVNVRTEGVQYDTLRLNVNFINCLFKNLNRAISVINVSLKINASYTFSKCKFLDINNAVLGPTDSSGYGVFGKATFDSCIFDIDTDAYIVRDMYPTAGYNSLYFYGRNIIEKENNGLYLKGNDNYYVVFDNQYWEHGNTVAFSGGVAKALGTRIRVLDETPSGVAFNDCDIAYVNGTKYVYTNNSWVQAS